MNFLAILLQYFLKKVNPSLELDYDSTMQIPYPICIMALPYCGPLETWICDSEYTFLSRFRMTESTLYEEITELDVEMWYAKEDIHKELAQVLSEHKIAVEVCTNGKDHHFYPKELAPSEFDVAIEWLNTEFKASGMYSIEELKATKSVIESEF